MSEEEGYIELANWQSGKAGTIYLIPSPLSSAAWEDSLPGRIREVCNELSYFFAENLRTSRRFLSKLKLDRPIDQLRFEEVSKKTSFEEILELLQPVLSGTDAGMLSEAGCPGVADPGADLVQAAHQLGIKVVPLVGPSSFLLALMASGLNGQAFTFHGYLPLDKVERQRKIRELDKEARQKECTQLFMETPYRNQKLFEELLKTCQQDTQLCIARDLTGERE